MSSSPEKPQFYQRPLPDSCLPFDSDEGQAVFSEALAEGYMKRFFALVAQFRTQDEPAYCGLGTLTMALNTLQIDPGRVWKGVWRWYEESLLDCCKDLLLVQEEGITIDEFVCLAKCNGCNASMTRPGDAPGTVADFRRCVEEVCSGRDSVLCCSYSRKILGQTGDGHFTPIGGYNKAKDLVLLLDVARFKYPPHWVPLELCYESMTALDSVTGLARGWVLLSATQLCLPHICECSEEEAKLGEAVIGRITGGLAPIGGKYSHLNLNVLE